MIVNKLIVGSVVLFLFLISNVNAEGTCSNNTDWYPLSDDFDWFKIELYKPEQGRISHDNETFNFTVFDTGGNHPEGFNCSLYIDGGYVNSSIIQPDDGEANYNCGESDEVTCSIIAPLLADGRYDWNVSCGTNMTLSQDVRIDAVAPFYVWQCNDTVDLENETFYLSRNIRDEYIVGEGVTWNHTRVNCEDENYDICVPITAFNSTLNGNGFNITGWSRGDYVGAGNFPVAVGILPNVDNVTIINVNTSNMSIGILACESNHSKIMHNDVSQSGAVDDGETDSPGAGIIAIGVNAIQIINNTVNYIQQSGNLFTYYSSCPFIYVWDGVEWIIQNEDLSPFHAYWNEDDYSARLPNLKAIDGLLKIMIVENLNEITYFDFIALTKVVHTKNTEAYKDVDGNTYTVNDLKKPIKCVDSNTDCLKVISEEDDMYWNWQYDGDIKKADFVMEAVLTFEKEGDFAKLLWKPKLNADTLDPLYVDLLDYVGTSNYDIFEKKVEEGEQWEGHKDAITTLYLWNGKDWELLHIGIESMAVNHAGKWVVPVDLSGIKGDTFKIKIVTFPLAGGPDFVWADFSEDAILSEELIRPYNVSCNNKIGINEFFNDDQYYAILEKGDKCEVTFNEPKVVAKKLGEVVADETTYFTKSNGYYVPDFTKDIRSNEKNVITKFILETTFDTFWSHPDLRSVGDFFPEKYMSRLTTNYQKHPVIPSLFSEDKPYHTAAGIGVGLFSVWENFVSNNTIIGDDIAGMEVGVHGIITSNLTAQNNFIKNVRTCGAYVYTEESRFLGNTCYNFNASCMWAYSAIGNEFANNTCQNATSPDGCFINPDSYQFLGNVCLLNTATQGDANYNTYHNNFCNATQFACVATLGEFSIEPNFWNSSNVSGGRIDGSGANRGGNYNTNPALDGYSDTCVDINPFDGFCDVPFDVENNVAGCSSNNCDYLPLANTRSCWCPGAGNNWVINLEDNCGLQSPCDLDGGNVSFINLGNWYCNNTLNCWNRGIGEGLTFYDNCKINRSAG